MLAALAAAEAQYPGQITKSEKNTPTLRAVAVFEWTGDEAKPKTSRLVPICIYDGQSLEDADEYLARPAPIALGSDVEYQLLSNGKPVGLFDIETAGQQQGSWVGFGKWKPLPKPKPPSKQVAKIDEYDDAGSDEPVLHRKHQDGATGTGSSGASGSGANAPAPDPDRPVLRPTASSPDTSKSSPASSSSGEAQADSDRPKMKKTKDEDDGGYVTSVDKLSDPNRPHLFRGKTAGYDVAVTPSLHGMPADMRQEVAVSDATDRLVHMWEYAWANPGDRAKMKAAMEDLARTALGLTPPTSTTPQPAQKGTSKAHKPVQMTLPPQPTPLLDERFRVFELEYGSGATMVLSARTQGSGRDAKYVTLIAQPNLYGNLAVLLKSVTDAAHLDDTPRMNLIDPVDALADNRGELLFELRGAAQRQFALYRVLRGEATRIFLSQPAALGAAASD